jgi:hypothetical protein
MRLTGWVALVVVIGAILLIMGGVISLVAPAMLVARGAPVGDAARVYAGYTASRDLALGGMLLGSLFLRKYVAMNTLLLLIAAIQFLDAGIDCLEGRWTVAPGVLVLGVIFLWTGLRR